MIFPSFGRLVVIEAVEIINIMLTHPILLQWQNFMLFYTMLLCCASDIDPRKSSVVTVNVRHVCRLRN